MNNYETIPQMRERYERQIAGLRKHLKWALDYIASEDSAWDAEDGATPDHWCNFDNAPDEGYCDWCEHYADARAALEDE